MLLLAATEHSIDLTDSWMVGDSDIDIQAGKTAGCRTLRILRNGVSPEITADLSAPSLFEAAHELMKVR